MFMSYLFERQCARIFEKVIDYEWNEIDTVNDQVDIVELKPFNKQTNKNTI